MTHPTLRPPAHRYARAGSRSARAGGADRGRSLDIVDRLTRLTRLLAGELSVESQPGQGSTFRLILPAAARIA